MIYTRNNPILAHVELSNICNAMCPQCGRNYIDKKTKELKMNKGLNNSELSLDDYKNIFDDRFYKNFKLEKVNYCGNKSDPIASSYLHQIVDYHLIKDKKTKITMSTNGSLKTEDWWLNFGKLLSKRRHIVSFGIDGLSDTHSTYRVNTNFEKIINNATQFIKGGGRAVWQYLVFEHNEHQIEEAKNLAKKIGFIEFKHIFTPRFTNFEKNSLFFTFKNKFYNLKESNLNDVSTPIREYRLKNTKEKNINIDCKAKNINEFFLRYDGQIFPCCWLATKPQNNVMAWYDKKMNALENDLSDILMKSMFLDVLEKSWKLSPCATCIKFCNKEINNKKDQYTTRERLQENGL